MSCPFPEVHDFNQKLQKANTTACCFEPKEKDTLMYLEETSPKTKRICRVIVESVDEEKQTVNLHNIDTGQKVKKAPFRSN